MARTTPLNASGLDLLDRLFRNQILVDLVFSTEDRKVLKSIAGRSRGMLAAAGLEGLILERAMHFALAGLEFLSADDVDEEGHEEAPCWDLLHWADGGSGRWMERGQAACSDRAPLAVSDEIVGPDEVRALGRVLCYDAAGHVQDPGLRIG